MSLDDLYNHLKIYEAEVQKKSNMNSQNMAFISFSKHSSGDEDGNTACVSTSNTTFPTASASDINQIDEDDIEEIDIKWSTALLSMRADKFWKRSGKKISIQGSDVAGFDKSKVECFNCHKMGHFAKECRAPRSQERGKKENNRQGSKAKEKTPKELMAIDGVGWDWSYMENKGEDHALVADVEASTEFALMANTESKHAYMSPSHRSAGHIPHGAPMRPPHRSASHRPHGASMRPSHRPAGHRPHGSSMNPMRPNMNGARPNRSFFIQAHSYETRPFLKSSSMKTQYRAPWVPTVNRNNPPVNRKFSTGRRNFPTVNRKFPTASRKFTTGSTKIHTVDMGRNGKAIKPS
nr:hypothetical protein [Tanacetum cinerariifolium]